VTRSSDEFLSFLLELCTFFFLLVSVFSTGYIRVLSLTDGSKHFEDIAADLEPTVVERRNLVLCFLFQYLLITTVAHVIDLAILYCLFVQRSKKLSSRIPSSAPIFRERKSLG